MPKSYQNENSLSNLKNDHAVTGNCPCNDAAMLYPLDLHKLVWAPLG